MGSMANGATKNLTHERVSQPPYPRETVAPDSRGRPPASEVKPLQIMEHLISIRNSARITWFLQGLSVVKSSPTPVLVTSRGAFPISPFFSPSFRSRKDRCGLSKASHELLRPLQLEQCIARSPASGFLEPAATPPRLPPTRPSHWPPILQNHLLAKEVLAHEIIQPQTI